MKKSDLIKIGSILKVNRKTGELTVALRLGADKIPETLKVIFLEIDGEPVPFFPLDEIIVSSEFLRVSLEDYNHPDQAQSFAGADVFVENSLQASNGDHAYTPEQLIGFKVIDKEYGAIGFVDQVVESPMQYILQINHNDKEILVPLVEAFILSIDEDNKTIDMDLPEGLIDLYV